MKSYVIKLLVLGLLLLGGEFSYAQVLKGVVIDADTKKGIKNVGTPDGTKNLKKLNLLEYKPKKVKPKNIINASINVAHI